MEIIIGAATSLLVQAIKRYVGTDPLWTLVTVFVISLIAAAFYVYIADTAFFEVLLQVLAYAGAFYTFIIQRFETE